MPFLRFSRDKRGYESTYLVETFQRRGKPPRTRILYWYRSPPGVKVGRPPFDEEVQRVIEARNPGVKFDWPTIVATPMPAQEPEPWWERRRAERQARQARRVDDREVEATEVASGPDAAEQPAIMEAEDAFSPDAPSRPTPDSDDDLQTDPHDNGVASDVQEIVAPDSQEFTTSNAPEAAAARPQVPVADQTGSPGPAGGRRRRRRGGRRRRGRRPEGATPAQPGMPSTEMNQSLEDGAGAGDLDHDNGGPDHDNQGFESPDDTTEPPDSSSEG